MPEEAEFRRVVRQISEAIAYGVHPPGSWLPRLRDLGAEYGVSVATLQRALDILEDRRVVSRHQGKGVRVLP